MTVGRQASTDHAHLRVLAIHEIDEQAQCVDVLEQGQRHLSELGDLLVTRIGVHNGAITSKELQRGIETLLDLPQRTKDL